MNTPSNTPSRLERIGGPAIVVLLAIFALYVGVSALITGQFLESGSRSNPAAVNLVTGLRAYFSGGFVASVGATLLVFLFGRRLPARSQSFCLAINAALFIAAVLSYVLAK